MAKNKTFIKITNRMIYDELKLIDKKFDRVNIKANVNSALIAVLIVIIVAIISLIK